MRKAAAKERDNNVNDQLGEKNLPFENKAVVPTRRWSVIPAVEECFHWEKSCSVFLGVQFHQVKCVRQVVTM